MPGGPAPGGMIRISGPSIIRAPIPMLEDDDDDDDGIPPEILDLIRMTSTLSQRSNSISMMPTAPRIRIINKPPVELHEDKPEPVANDHAIKIIEQPRHEESVEEILERMNKLGEEIGEKHENRRANIVNS